MTFIFMCWIASCLINIYFAHVLARNFNSILSEIRGTHGFSLNKVRLSLIGALLGGFICVAIPTTKTGFNITILASTAVFYAQVAFGFAIYWAQTTSLSPEVETIPSEATA